VPLRCVPALMSLSAHYPHTKSADIDIPLDDYPSSLEVALNGNGNGNTLKARHSFSKQDVDSGFLDPDTFRRPSTSTISGLSDDSRVGRPNSHTGFARYPSRSPAPPGTWKVALQRFWQKNRGLGLVTISQLFGALMNVTTRLLELEGEGMHPIQILFLRMILTSFCCCLYMWYTKVPYFPFGMKEVRLLLVLRSFSGFFGIFGMYCKLILFPRYGHRLLPSECHVAFNCSEWSWRSQDSFITDLWNSISMLKRVRNRASTSSIINSPSCDCWIPTVVKYY